MSSAILASPRNLISESVEQAGVGGQLSGAVFDQSANLRPSANSCLLRGFALEHSRFELLKCLGYKSAEIVSKVRIIEGVSDVQHGTKSSCVIREAPPILPDSCNFAL
ncbi:hypothetical protein GCM10025794_02370 [Massilia kyonggiensis]